MHLARTIVRRAERDVWLWFATDVESHIKESLSQLPLIYLNRLSDLLFVMSRHYSDGNEKLWRPMNG
jgi:cob(I)alamin adenosyltransferase